MQWRGELDAPRADGSSNRQAYESAQRQRGKPDARLVPPKIDIPFDYHGYVEMIKAIHEQIAMGRSYNDGPLSFTWHDIDCFCRVMDIKLSPWEVQVIIAMDSVFIATVNKIMSENTQ